MQSGFHCPVPNWILILIVLWLISWFSHQGYIIYHILFVSPVNYMALKQIGEQYPRMFFFPHRHSLLFLPLNACNSVITMNSNFTQPCLKPAFTNMPSLWQWHLLKADTRIAEAYHFSCFINSRQVWLSKDLNVFPRAIFFWVKVVFS